MIIWNLKSRRNILKLLKKKFKNVNINSCQKRHEFFIIYANHFIKSKKLQSKENKHVSIGKFLMCGKR